MMPLFEAISNAIDAIEEKGRGTGPRSGSIRVKLIAAIDDLVKQAGDGALIVDGFEVSDDGVGFTDLNFAAFEEAHTLSKLKLGGKGVGRFTFLKVFSKVEVQSIFDKSGQRIARSFSFSVENEVADQKLGPTAGATGTRVSVRGIAERYKSAWPHDLEVIAQRVIAHFLIRFAARSCPNIVLEAPSFSPLNLQDLFQKTVQPHIAENFFDVNGYTFALQALRNRDGRARHEYHLCANGREVTTGKLRQLLPVRKRIAQDDLSHGNILKRYFSRSAKLMVD
jgi:hypothetical protein